MKYYISSFLTTVKNFLGKNLGWKVFSIILALLLWFAVINATNPKEIWTFTMKMELKGVEDLAETQNVYVKNQRSLENSVVSVKIRGNRLDLETLNKLRSNLKAQANLGIIYDFTTSGDKQAPIDIVFPIIPNVQQDAFEVISKDPEYATVTLEEIVSEERPIKVTTTGAVAEGYVELSPVTTPETVTLTGPKSKLQQIDSVSVEVQLDNEKDSIYKSMPPRLLTKDLKDVDGVDCSADNIGVEIKIAKYKKVPVIASHVGQPAEGYVVSSMQLDPEYIEVVGSESEVSVMGDLVLPPINVSGLTEINMTSYDIRNMNILPENVSIKNGTPNAVMVTAVIEKVEEKDIVLPSSLISTSTLMPNVSYTVKDSALSIKVKGVESVISSLTNEQIKLSVDLQGLPFGDHSVPVNVELPENLELASDPPTVNITIQEPSNTIENVNNIINNVLDEQADVLNQQALREAEQAQQDTTDAPAQEQPADEGADNSNNSEETGTNGANQEQESSTSDAEVQLDI